MPSVRMQEPVHPTSRKSMHGLACEDVGAPFRTPIEMQSRKVFVAAAIENFLLQHTKHDELVHRAVSTSIGSVDIDIAVSIVLVVSAHLQDAEQCKRVLILLRKHHC